MKTLQLGKVSLILTYISKAILSDISQDVEFLASFFPLWRIRLVCFLWVIGMMSCSYQRQLLQRNWILLQFEIFGLTYLPKPTFESPACFLREISSTHLIIFLFFLNAVFIVSYFLIVFFFFLICISYSPTDCLRYWLFNFNHPV